MLVNPTSEHRSSHTNGRPHHHHLTLDLGHPSAPNVNGSLDPRIAERSEAMKTIASLLFGDKVDLSNSEDVVDALVALELGFSRENLIATLTGVGGFGERAAIVVVQIKDLINRRIYAERNVGLKSQSYSLLRDIPWQLFESQTAEAQVSALVMPQIKPDPSLQGPTVHRIKLVIDKGDDVVAPKSVPQVPINGRAEPETVKVPGANGNTPTPRAPSTAAPKTLSVSADSTERSTTPNPPVPIIAAANLESSASIHTEPISEVAATKSPVTRGPAFNSMQTQIIALARLYHISVFGCVDLEPKTWSKAFTDLAKECPVVTSTDLEKAFFVGTPLSAPVALKMRKDATERISGRYVSDLKVTESLLQIDWGVLVGKAPSLVPVKQQVSTMRIQRPSNNVERKPVKAVKTLDTRVITERSSNPPKAFTVFDAILRYGHDEDFDPTVDNHFLPTDAPAGSQEKIEIMRRRIELGQPLHHPDDRVDYAGLVAAVRPRE